MWAKTVSKVENSNQKKLMENDALKFSLLTLQTGYPGLLYRTISGFVIPLSCYSCLAIKLTPSQTKRQEASPKKQLSQGVEIISQTLSEVSHAVLLPGITIATDKNIDYSKIPFLLPNAGGR